MKFRNAITGKDQLAIIAEVKLKSPSHGVFEGITLDEQVKKYLAADVAAISLVTDPKRFNGSVELIRETRALTDLPIIRKDFIHDRAVLDETKTYGADAALLIVKDLTKEELDNLVHYCFEIGIDPVAEVHSAEDCKKITGLPAETVILINNRNLDTLEIDVRHGLTILPHVPSTYTIIAASGFVASEEVALYKGKVDAILVGTTLLTTPDPAAVIRSWRRM